jgi:flagellar motility protein MotE (MotC chaperone)
VLAAGFVLSAALRAGEVVAALPERAGDGFGNPLPAADGAEAAARETATELIAELRTARRETAERARALDEREQTLEAIEDRLRTRLEELEAARAELERTAALVDGAAGRDVRHLAQMYETMKPKQAAVIFDRMTPSFAAGFLAEMDADAAALVLANMDADKAYAVSLLLATRNVEREPPR